MWLAVAALGSGDACAQVEIAYDDGSPESDLVWRDPGNGVAVRFTTGPDAALAGAKFYITSAPFQNPLGVCVLDTNGPGGAPGDTILGYSERLVDVWPGFIEVEFPKPLMVPNDGAYIVYLQTRGGNGDSDCIGVDKSSPPESRSWIHESGLWTRMTPSQGNVMIRAIVTTETPIVKRSWGVLRAIHR